MRIRRPRPGIRGYGWNFGLTACGGNTELLGLLGIYQDHADAMKQRNSRFR